MYYSNDNTSILQAVTRSTFNTSTSTTHNPGSPPSPVAPVSDLNDPENDIYSYAFVSTGEIDLAAIKKEKAQKPGRLIEDESLGNAKGDANSMQEEDSNAITTTSRRTRYYYYLVLTMVLTACFILVVLPLLGYDDYLNRLSSTINNIKDMANNTVNPNDPQWYWQNYRDKLGWDQSKAWLHQGKTTLFTRLWTLQPQAQKYMDDSFGWLDSTRQSVMAVLVRCFF